MDDLLSEFVTETVESLDLANVELVKLEQDPNDHDTLSNIFRLVHTIKGTCGFLGLPRLQAIAHAGENVLGQFRDGKLHVTEGAVTVVLECLDRIRDIVAHLEQTGAEPEGDDEDLIARLEAIANGDAPGVAWAEPAETAEVTEVAPSPEPEESQGDTLFDRLGGPIGVDAIVDLLFMRLQKDRSFGKFYENVDIDDLKLKYSSFLTMALGGPSRYTGKSIAKAHAPHQSKGLTAEHVDTFFKYLREAMSEFEIEDDLANKIAAVMRSTRDDILPAGKAEAAADAKSEAKPAAKAKAEEPAKPAAATAPASP